MSEFFHVLITLRGGAEHLLLEDLSRAALQNRFLKPYQRGEKLTVAGRIVDPHDLSGVRIIKTPDRKEAAMDRLFQEGLAATDRMNTDAQASGVVIMPPLYSRDTDIEHAGEDVTSAFVKGAPGSAGTLAHYLNHPWTLTILGGLIVAGLAAMIFG